MPDLLLWCMYAFLGALAATGATLFVYGLNLHNRRLLRHIPGPRPGWLLGNVLQMGPQGKSHDALLSWSQQYGPVFRYFLGRRACVVLTDPELVRQVSVKRFIDYHDRPQPALENGTPADNLFQNTGILFARGKRWLGIRTACEPLFHSAALASYAPMMNNATGKLLEKLQAAAGTDTGVCVSELLKALSIDIIGDTVFGVGFGAQEEGGNRRLLEAAEAMFAPMGGLPFWAAILMLAVPELTSAWYHLALLVSPKSINQTIADRRYLWGTSQALLDSARKHAAAEKAEATAEGKRQLPPAAKAGVKPSEDPLSGKAQFSAAFEQAYKTFAARTPPQSSIVSRLKAAVNKQTGELLSDVEICSQLFTFLLAGYETTSLALSYALYLLAKHPQHQQKIMQEVDALGDRELTYDDLAQLHYTEAVFHESMRLYPPISSLLALARVPRDEGVDLVLSGNNASSNSVGSTPAPSTIHLPGGSRIMFNIWALHRDPRYWEQPEEFRPKRFLPGSEEATRHPGAYFPFGLGPRRCVGWRFALEEGVLCLARIFRRFELRLDPEHHTGPLEPQLRTSVTLFPEGGIWVRVHNRS